MVIAHLEELFDTGKYDEALEKIEELDEKDRLEGEIYRCRLLLDKRELNKASNLANYLNEEVAKSGNKVFEIALLANKCRLSRNMNFGKLEETLYLTEQAEKRLETLNAEERKEVKIWEHWIFHLTAWTLMEKGELDLALEYAHKDLALTSTILYKNYTIFALNNLGGVYASKGDYDQTLKYFQNGLEIAELIDNKLSMGLIVGNIGVIYAIKGKLNKSLENYIKASHLREESGVPSWKYPNQINNMGHIYELKGELDQALRYYQEALKSNRSLNSSFGIAASYCNIGRVYFKKNQVDQALENFSQGLKELPAGNVWIKSGILYDLILINLELKDVDQAQDYFNELERLNEQSDVFEVNIKYRLSKAMMLKNSERMKFKANAQIIFEEIIKEENCPHDLKVFAMLNLCDLLLDELEAYREKEVFQQTDELVREIYEIAQEQHSHNLIVEALILKSKFELIKGDIAQSMKLLEQAKLIAEERDLTLMLENVIREQKKMDEKMDIWRDLIEKDASLKERLEKVKLLNYIEDALKIAALPAPTPKI